MKRTICLDFDGVLTPGHLNLDPLPGALEFLAELHRRDWNIVIQSVRAASTVKAWLAREGCAVPVDVVDRKPPAMVYLDDRGLTFTGDFDAALAAIDGFRAWWEAEVWTPSKTAG